MRRPLKHTRYWLSESMWVWNPVSRFPCYFLKPDPRTMKLPYLWHLSMDFNKLSVNMRMNNYGTPFVKIYFSQKEVNFSFWYYVSEATCRKLLRSIRCSSGVQKDHLILWAKNDIVMVTQWVFLPMSTTIVCHSVHFCYRFCFKHNYLYIMYVSTKGP